MSSGAFALLAGAALLLLLGSLLLVAMLLGSARNQSRLRARIEPELSDTGEFESDGQGGLMRGVARGGRAIEGWIDPENEGARMLVQAGWRSEQSRALWYLLQASVPVVGLGGVIAYWLLAPDSKQKGLFLLMFGFVAFAFSLLIPRWILRGAANGRRARIKAEVPLFIHLLVLLFEAGLSTRQAFASLVREGGGVLPNLGQEFELVLRQLEAGADTGELLKNVGDVMQVDDLTSVLGVLRQVDRYGGEVREPLLEALSLLEERRGLDMREQVNLLSGRMTVIMVLFFFPALLIFVAGPAFMAVIKALNAAVPH